MGKSYKNKSSDTQIRLSPKAKTNNMVSVKFDSSKVMWGYKNVSMVDLKVEQTNSKEEAMELPHLCVTGIWEQSQIMALC